MAFASSPVRLSDSPSIQIDRLIEKQDVAERCSGVTAKKLYAWTNTDFLADPRASTTACAILQLGLKNG